MSDDRRKWRRVGVIVPSPNTTVEADFMRALPANVTVHATRMFLASGFDGADGRKLGHGCAPYAAGKAAISSLVLRMACA